MNSNLKKLILIIIIIINLPRCYYAQNKNYDACSNKLQCGPITDISYPFYDDSTRPESCGYPGFKLHNCDTDNPQITISNNQTYNLLHIDTTKIRVSRTDSWNNGCPDRLTNSTLDFSKFNFSSADQNITFFYDCPEANYSNVFFQSKCDLGGNGLRSGYYFTQDMLYEFEHVYMLQVCKTNILLPIQQSQAQGIAEADVHIDAAGLILIIRSGFWLDLLAENDACSSCIGSGGECGYDWVLSKFICHCPDADYDSKCKLNSSLNQVASGHLMKKHISITASSAAITIIVLGCLVLFTYYIYQKYKLAPENQSVEDCLRNYASLVSRRYTYSSIRKMTNSFREKLGEGGYGTVYKGSLQDGRVVAVKVWKQSKGDGQEFLNEVMSISSTNHVNIVPLLGFCFEGHKRALVYEFMSNGSLEKFLHRKDSNKNSTSLSSEKLLDIAIGIAKGLEYLHRGCNTRIVHFDIKPHNILLDAEFTPKISDFGLSKSMKQKESIISMSGARGTAGYIAPEVFFRTFGGVSHKSDVYSFGMMVLEMVGCTKRVNQDVHDSSAMYFPDWIYKQLDRETTLDSGRIMNEDNKELERKMILVGLWCIQTNPMSRPPMSSVVEMLEGKVELQVPPIPSLSSPQTQQQSSSNDGSTTSNNSYPMQTCYFNFPPKKN